jgi:hypothetical protein
MQFRLGLPQIPAGRLYFRLELSQIRIAKMAEALGGNASRAARRARLPPKNGCSVRKFYGMERLLSFAAQSFAPKTESDLWKP